MLQNRKGSPMPQANAHPTKRFFIEMFTRDIPLQDCVLDLVDNCVDGLARTERLKLHTISDHIFGKTPKEQARGTERPYVRVDFDAEHFRIHDNCGGIDYEYALRDVFNFGHTGARSHEYLGVYGVGMKRAVFKMGDEFTVDSRTTETGFTCRVDVPAWMAKDDSLDDWTITLTQVTPAKTANHAGTTIEVKNLKKEVSDLFATTRFESDLIKTIGRVYAFLVGTHIRIYINGTEVKPFEIPVGAPKKGQTSYDQFQEYGVKVRVFATLTSAPDNGPTKENSGWYIACNGRLVLVADTSETTGWGVSPMPIWVPKYTAFIGFVFFEAKNGLDLPWTTTKRNVNKESAVYRKAISRMAVLARPILSFCNRKYPADTDQEPVERAIAKELKPTTLAHLVRSAGSAFKMEEPEETQPRTTVRVQYDALLSDVDKVRKHLRTPRMGATKVGEHTFSYFLNREGLK